MHPSLIGNIGQIAGSAATGREVIRQRPHKRSAGASLGELAEALASHLGDMGKADVNIEPRPSVPPDTFRGKVNALLDQDAYLASGKVANTGNYGVNYNPNSDRALLAHELGHVASQQTDVGRIVSDLRHSPAMKDTLTKAALMTVPAGAVAALTQGDDDLAGSVALTYAMSAPTILDEALATHHGLKIMDRASLAPTLGGRAKLAGGLLSYLATPLAVGATANLAGNLMDNELVGTQGELPM